MNYRFRELDDLVLQLKGLVLVRDLLARCGAGAKAIATHDAEIDRVRNRLAALAKDASAAYGVIA